MNTTKKTTIIALIIVIAVIVLVVVKTHGPKITGNQTPVEQATATASYACSAGKTITAAYYTGATAASNQSQNGQPPVPTGSVVLTLGDGRTMTLPQTISADGIRYANSDGSFVFWSKGNGAFVLENNNQTYMGCVRLADDPGGLPKSYANGTEGFSIRYPANYTVDENYTYQNLGPGKDIGGIKFTIDPVIASGTNLGTDSYISVEEIPNTTSCSASLFLDAGNSSKVTSVTDSSNTTYSVASSTGAGAGNRYEETVYAMPGTNPCIAIRYYIHYSVLENYPTGTVKAFDQAALLKQFDSMRTTLVISQ